MSIFFRQQSKHGPFSEGDAIVWFLHSNAEALRSAGADRGARLGVAFQQHKSQGFQSGNHLSF